MHRREVEAYNAGVNAMAGLARATADRLATKIAEQPTRLNFAIGALDGLAEEGAALLLTVPEMMADV